MNTSRRFLLVFGLASLSSLSCNFMQATRFGASLPDVASAAPIEREIAAVELALRNRHTGLRPEVIPALAETIVTESHAAGFTPRFVLAVIHVESSGYSYAISPVGAMGLMQLLPGTAESIAPAVGVEWNGPPTLFDPIANVRLGIYYLRQLVGRFGDVDTALAAYNWGPTAIATRLRNGDALPVDYIHAVEDAYLRPSRGFGLQI